MGPIYMLRKSWPVFFAALVILLTFSLGFAFDQASVPANSGALVSEAGNNYAPGEVLVKLRSEVPPDTGVVWLNNQGYEVKEELRVLNIYRLSTKPGLEWDVIKALQNASRVEYAEPN